MSKPQPGAYRWNEDIRQIKDAMRLLRHDIDELRAANPDNADVLNFLLTMSGRIDTVFDAANDIWEIGQEHKQSRLNNGE
jgi:lipoprotein NlpI